jgi:MGT family glycosyltransferase
MDANREMTAQALEEVKRENPDYIIYDFMVFFGRIINITLNVPTVVSIPVFVLNKHTLKEFPSGFRLKMLGMALIGLKDIVKLILIARWYRNHYGISVSDILSLKHIYQELNIVYTSDFFQPVSHVLDTRFRFIGPDMFSKREVQGFSADGLAGKRVIYISLGTAFGNNPKFYHRCFRAFGDCNFHVILSVGSLVNISKMEDIPGNFMVRNHVPQLQILKHTDVFITHGGMNSTAEGILNGVPLIVFPQAADQYLVARRVEQLGAGIYLKWPTPTKLRKSVHDILSNPKYKKNCEIIADSFRKSGGAKAGARAIFDFINDLSENGKNE